ncbi:J domain-containing protein [Methylobacter psychrophilus]|uniref:J domain-containing protein n=1 Tax=Methylobacter psychrophilus TaxID=96941 RepID=UPI0021D4E53E|nr:DnaJ domain-containing protein [Methylobacter psychrophilus]
MSAIKKDYYQILGIIDCTDLAIIKAVYKALMMIYHPDRYAGNKDEAVRKSKEINEAYGVLIDPDKRKKYDAGRNCPPLTSANSKSTSHALEIARQACTDHYENILTQTHRDYELKINALKTSISFNEATVKKKDDELSCKEADLVKARNQIKSLKISARHYADELTVLLTIIKDELP